MAKKVLIIEDRREQIVFIANNILKPEGWEVITARDGELGLHKAIEEQPDLIITDLKLPKLHGLDVLEALNNQGFRIPTIVMTFHGSEQTAIRAFRLGAVDYLIKPFEVDEIMAAIDRALQGKGVGPAPPDSGDAAVSEKLANQQREIQRLKSILQQQQVALQKLGSGQQSYTETADAASWQALLKEKEAALARFRKQAIVEHQKTSQQINHLRAQLAEKEAIVANLQQHIGQVGLAADGQSEGVDFFAQLEEKETALAQAEKLVKTLNQKIAAQQQDIEMHRNEAERLARELHVLATGIQMLGQSLSDQASQIPSNALREE